MQNPSLGHRLDRALLALQLSVQGSAVGYSRDVVSSSADHSVEPPDVDRAADVAAALAGQLATGLEQYTAAERASVGLMWSELTWAVRMLPGYASGFVAFMLNEPVERVQQARAALDVDPVSGLREPKPLTSRDLPAAWAAVQG